MITHLKHNVVLQIALIAIACCIGLLCYRHTRLKDAAETSPYRNLERVSMDTNKHHKAPGTN